MKIRKSKKAIGPRKFSPPVGFQIAPSAPAGGGTNVAAMRPNFAFLPYNADAYAKFVNDEEQKERADNPKMDPQDFPGVQDPYGTGIIPSTVGSRTDLNASCAKRGGRVWVSSSNQCECPDNYYAKTRDSPCQPYSF
jgi:hypothetical protein